MGIKINEDGFKQPVYSVQEVEKYYVKVYGDALEKLIEIQGCPRNLILFLTREMDENNIVHVGQYLREKFIAHVEKVSSGKVTYSDISVKKAFQALKDIDLLISLSKGVYQINPEYFFVGPNENVRLNMIKENLESWKKKDKINFPDFQ